MEQAGQWVAQTALARWQCQQTILILAGKGNNGGDALVAARILIQKGFHPEVYIDDENPQKQTPSRQTQQQKLEQNGGSCQLYSQGCLQPLKGKSLLVIDGLLGLGLKGPLRPGTAMNMLREVASLEPADVLAIDIPSGMQADIWAENEPPLAASTTLTFGAYKPCHLLSPACLACGQVLQRRLGFDTEVVTQVLRETPDQCLEAIEPSRKPDAPASIWQDLPASAHKFERGHVLVMGGSPGKWGAPVMSGLAASRAGAGWVSLALAGEQADIGQIPLNLTSENLWRQGQIDVAACYDFIANRKVRGLVIGPGLQQSPITTELLTMLSEFVNNGQLFVVFDGGALHGLGPLLQDQDIDPNRLLGTPHPGEWQKMRISNHRWQSLEELQQVRNELFDRIGLSVIYKTATPIAPLPRTSGQLARIHPGQQIALAKAGSGDLLTGLAVVIGLRGIPAYQAGLQAYHQLHIAASQASNSKNPHSLMADDLLAEVAQLAI
jgi:NAD(P)H-hydrate epimerase